MGIEFNGMIFPAWMIGAVIVVFLLALRFRRRPSLPYILCLAVFSIYILKALDLTFFPLQLNGPYVDAMRSIPIRSFINLIPFYFGEQHILDNRDLIEFTQNILLTMPFGFGILFVSRLRPKDFLWLPLAIGFGIEAVQLIISLILKYPYRVIDINDTLLNAVGVLGGYALFRILAWVFVKITRRLKHNPGEWLGFFQEVATRT